MHRWLDVRPGSEWVAFLIQWWTRFGDSMWHGAFPTGPSRESFWPWHREAVHALMRELLACHWDRGEVLRSLFRAQASSSARCPTAPLARRMHVLTWMMRVVAEEWDQVAWRMRETVLGPPCPDRIVGPRG